MLRILLVEDSVPEARLLQELLKGSGLYPLAVTHVKRLAEALSQCDRQSPDVVLLDLTLPDSYGLDSLDTFIRQAPRLPIVVLTHTNDDELAGEAVRRGAQDYLVKQQVTGDLLVRAVRYAIKRKQGEEALREANETLELRVQQRTAELKTANDRLQTEIQQRQRIQERLQLAQESAHMGSFEWNLAQGQVIWSAELERLYGVAVGGFKGAIGPWLAQIHPEDRPRVEGACAGFWPWVVHGEVLSSQRLTELKPIRNLEFRAQGADGRDRWMTLTSILVAGEDGQPEKLVGLHRDITEAKQWEAQFLRAQRLESLGTLASGIAHDLNNILTPILGIAQLLLLKLPQLDDSNRHLLKTMEASARRGSDLIKQILSFAQGLEGKRVALKLNHLLREVRQILQETLPKSVRLELDLAPDLWNVAGDATQLHQVFMNLCVNGRDAMAKGGILTLKTANVHLSSEQTRPYSDAQPGPYVVVTVTDTGTGIPPEVLPKIFDPFFTTKGVGEGTGLGLSAVLGIVKSHGGFLDVQSQPGQGSQFQIYLPVTPTGEVQTSLTSSLWAGEQELVMVVDDEATIREVLKTSLEAYDYRVVTASSGLEALTLYRQYRLEVAVVLLDLMMPAMDGFTTLNLLRQVDPWGVAIAMSGLHTAETRDRALGSGFQAFLTKPILTQELLTTLHQVLVTDSTALEALPQPSTEWSSPLSPAVSIRPGWS